ncbi:hypothetical protein SODALDRAFT_322607 [Sodiomyces alkalinus F11]|uniref:Cytochrome b2 n=1 Tax=Sodiomyces alkalinus (strain CBS 110278 / VKM F-3762 / F11) TaxID=1314773 RepID=A0A3N2Q455_SODAK|nr:hypothetical protein SODALDRAFT_322607 [Sodiomyces alkalinus F11]ROT41487.1 hypothetical protein SODALDRAFT_322607 [Sodiomyces alkalinus F11]
MDAREVAKHRSAASCWIVLHGKVYDVTDYLPEHPGGKSVLLRWAGKGYTDQASRVPGDEPRANRIGQQKDATAEYSKVHSPSTVEETLTKEKQLGPLDSATVECLDNGVNSASGSGAGVARNDAKQDAIPHIDLCVRLDDFVEPARRTISEQAFTYISSAADTLQSYHDNAEQWSKVSFIPRVLRDVSRVDLSTCMFGQRCAMPFFIAATALVGLTHPDGEAGLARVAAARGVHYSPSTYTSVPHAKIAKSHGEAAATGAGSGSGSASGPADSRLFSQLYVHSRKEKTLSLIQEAKRLGYRALMITVDTPCVGNRDEDRRLKIRDELELGGPLPESDADGEPRVVPGRNSGGLSQSLNWEDLKWIREAWGGPIALKGIQSAEDAKLAMEAGVEAVYLSNHGGRQLHSAPPCLATLLQIRRQYPEVLRRCEIFVDGGVARGGDILKAICLGAKAVGIGRPLLYAMGAYGPKGVHKAIDILKYELETTMALLGATNCKTVSELRAATERSRGKKSMSPITQE